MTRSKVGLPPLSTRKASCISRGPSIETPTRKSFSLRKAAHSSSIRVALVCMVLRICLARGSGAPLELERRAGRSRCPIMVGSPPWKATTTSSAPRCAASSWPT